MQPWFQRQSREVRLILAGLLLLVVAGVVVALVVSGSSGSSHKPAGESPAAEAEAEQEVAEISGEVAEAEQEVAEEDSNPHKPHGFEEIVIADPGDESATAEQIATQIQTNEESQDPTHQQEASCSISGPYRDYSHFRCIAYTVGGQTGLSQVEVTVNKRTGEVSAEIVEP